MAMGKCPGCGRGFRSGTLVTLLEDPPRRARVCAGCARRGLVVVAPVVAAQAKAAPPRQAAGTDEVVRQLRSYARLAEASAKAEDTPEAQYHRGRAEGFDGAIQLLKRSRGAS